jgi:hypothetical protein
MLLNQPLARSTQPQAGAVHQQVHGLSPAAGPWHVQRLGAAAQGGMVWNCQIQAEQPEERADQALRLAQCQMEYRPQGQRRLDRQGGVTELAITGGAQRRPPGLDRRFGEPHCQTTAGTQASLVGRPFVTRRRCFGM